MGVTALNSVRDFYLTQFFMKKKYYKVNNPARFFEPIHSIPIPAKQIDSMKVGIIPSVYYEFGSNNWDTGAFSIGGIYTGPTSGPRPYRVDLRGKFFEWDGQFYYEGGFSAL